jgi:hypothetical protein
VEAAAGNRVSSELVAGDRDNDLPGTAQSRRCRPRPRAIGARVHHARRRPRPEFSRFLYTAVGGDRHWLDRLQWTLRQWTDWLARPGAENWFAWVNGAPAGYVELNAAMHDDGTHAEIAFFFVVTFINGTGNILLFIYPNELFPTQGRASAAGSATARRCSSARR